MTTACCNLIKIGGGGGRVAHKYHDICIAYLIFLPEHDILDKNVNTILVERRNLLQDIKRVMFIENSRNLSINHFYKLSPSYQILIPFHENEHGTRKSSMSLG